VNGSRAQLLHTPVLDINPRLSVVGYAYDSIGIGKERGIAIVLFATNPFQNDFHGRRGRSCGDLRIFLFVGWLIYTRLSLALVDCTFYGPVEVRLPTFICLQIAL